MTRIIVTRLLINTMPLSSLILINSNFFFIIRKRKLCLVEKKYNLIKLVSRKRKTKKINFQLSRCFLKQRKSTLLSTAKGNKVSCDLSLRNVFNSPNVRNNKFLQKLYQKNVKKFFTKYYNLYSNHRHITEKKNDFININKGDSIRSNGNSSRKIRILQDFKFYKPNEAFSAPILSLMQKPLNPESTSAKKIKLKANDVSPVHLKRKNYFTKKNISNTLVLERLKDKAGVALRKKNENGFNSHMPITLPSQYYASNLIQNILCLNTTIKEAYSVASLAYSAQEDKRSDLIKLDKRLSHIQEIIEGLIQTKQNEMNNLTFNSFNEKRKKTYSDFL